MNKRIVKYKCPYCDRRLEKDKLVKHVELVHYNMIPEDSSAMRLVFDYVNKKPKGYNGRCTICGKDTKWDENKGRYDRQCSDACRKKYVEIFEANMNRKLGVTRISNSAEGQERMLAHRKISGTYKFQNGISKTYTGSYEKKALEFMDKVMNIDPNDIITPGPVLEYIYEGKRHLYITDILYVPYNLVIEVKDGGANPNGRPMREYREKQIAKEDHIIKNTNYNYLRLTDNNLSQLLAVMADLKMQLNDNDGNKRVIHVNESIACMMNAPVIGINSPCSTYVVNYMQNNVFAGGPSEKKIGLSNNIKLTNMVAIDPKDGLLKQVEDDYLFDKDYSVYKIDKSPEQISDILKKHMNSKMDESTLYEMIFGHKKVTDDQICYEDCLTEVPDYYATLESLEKEFDRYLKDDEYSEKSFSECVMNINNNSSSYNNEDLIAKLDRLRKEVEEVVNNG